MGKKMSMRFLLTLRHPKCLYTSNATKAPSKFLTGGWLILRNVNQVFILLLLATTINLGATVCHGVELHVTAPEEIYSDADSVTFQLAAEGYDTDEVTKVVWNFSYYKFYERNTDPYDYMEPVTLSTVSDLVVTREGTGVTISEMERLCREHGTLGYGKEGEDILVLQFSIIVEAFAGDETIGKSPRFDASFDFIATRGLTLTVSGPQKITRDKKKATFALQFGEGELGEVEEVGWFFEYHTDAEWAQDMFGGWLSIPGQDLFGILKPVTCEALQLNEEGKPLNLSYLRELGENYAPEDTGILRMRVYVKAYLPNHSPLAESDHHEFEIWGEKVLLTLEHFHPFEYFKAGTGTDIEPAGGLVSLLKEPSGQPVKGKRVYFFAVKEENAGQSEPGKNLRGVLKPAPIMVDVPVFEIFGIDEKTYLDAAWTNDSGGAEVNYILQNLIDPVEFSKILIQQTYIHGEEAKIGGTIKAVTVDPENNEIDLEASVEVEFGGIAQIVSITGEGRSQKYKDVFLEEYPPLAPWGPGRVRVKRGLAHPTFDYKPVEEGFLLMPGDIIDIDGGVKIEIAWINGNKATIQLPISRKMSDCEPPIPHAKIVLLPTAYDSGFHYPIEDKLSGLFGFGVMKGVDAFIQVLEKIPLVGIPAKVAKLSIDIYKATVNKMDWSKLEALVKVRVRSIVRIDSTGEDVEVYNLQGSPDIKTRSGQEITLSNRTMVNISSNGGLGEPQDFDLQADIEEWPDFIVDQIDIQVKEAILPIILSLILLPILPYLKRNIPRNRKSSPPIQSPKTDGPFMIFDD